MPLGWFPPLRLRAVRRSVAVRRRHSSSRQDIARWRRTDEMTNAANPPVRRQTVLDRVEMDVIHMGGEIAIIADRAPSTAAAKSRVRHGWSSPVTAARYGQRFCKRGLDRPPPAGKIGVAFRQRPQTVHVVGKDDPGVDMEWRAGARLPNRLAQSINSRHQQVRPSVKQIHCEEEGSSWNPIAAVVRHERSMPGLAERRNALRFSALRLLASAVAS